MSTEMCPKLKRRSEPYPGSLPYHPIHKVQPGSARLTSSKARHSQHPAKKLCPESEFLPQTGIRALHKHTELLVKKRAEPCS